MEDDKKRKERLSDLAWALGFMFLAFVLSTNVPPYVGALVFVTLFTVSIMLILKAAGLVKKK